jgi:hypothetical protein
LQGRIDFRLLKLWALETGKTCVEPVCPPAQILALGRMGAVLTPVPATYYVADRLSEPFVKSGVN